MLSLCLTNYNRYDMLLESFQHVYDDPRITEIVISDDCSDIKIWNKLVEYCKGKPKIKLFRNEKNVGMSFNKKLAIERASNRWCIIFDSDNILRPNYLDAFEKYLKENTGKPFPHSNPLNEGATIYCPDAALPQFSYKKFSGILVSKSNAKKLLKEALFDCLLNTCNYIVCREYYLYVYQYNKEIKASDTIHFNYLWLKGNGSLYIVPDMEYFHRVGPQSGFLADVNYNMQQAEKTKHMIMKL